MKISIRVALFGKGQKLIDDPLLQLRSDKYWAEYDHDDPRLLHIIDRSAAGLRLLFVPRDQFCDAEMESAAWFEVFPSRTLRGAESDSERLAEFLRTVHVHDGGGLLGGGVRRLLSVALPASRVSRVRDGDIRVISDEVPEYVVGDGVVAALSAAGLTGWSTGPVVNAKTGIAIPGAHLLTTDRLSGPIDQDESLLVDGTRGLARVRSLVFPQSSLVGLPDFARTCEPLEVSGFASWLVSQEVRRTLVRSRIKGWRLHPVLELGSELHRRSRELWTLVLAMIRRNPANDIGPFWSLPAPVHQHGIA